MGNLLTIAAVVGMASANCPEFAPSVRYQHICVGDEDKRTYFGSKINYADCQAKCASLGVAGCCESRSESWGGCNFFEGGRGKFSHGHRDTKVVLCTENKLVKIRFNKFNAAKVLIETDYPPSGETLTTLRTTTNASSVTVQKDCRNCLDIAEMVNRVGGGPTHPTGDITNPYWEDLREVIDRQYDRRANVEPSDFMPLPDIWGDFDIHEVADAVHDEVPGVWHAALIHQLLREGAGIDRDMIPGLSKVDFVHGAVALSQLNGWAIGTVSPTNFGAKWMFGRARPEEVAWKIANGEVGEEDGVPADICQRIRAMKLTSPFSFTAYPEGSPVHPSWPAMHSAASSGALWLSVVMNLTPRQVCETRKVDYGVAYARTVAGVHYPTDNFAGLNIGQEVIAEELPKFLAEHYGADPAKVSAKIQRLRYDWRNFPESDCFKGTEFKIFPGATCGEGFEPLTSSWQDCEAAAKSLGFTGDSVGFVSYRYPWGTRRPQGCFRSNGNNRFHFNTGAGGSFQGNDRILCKLQGRYSTQTSGVNACKSAGLQDVLDPVECASAASELKLTTSNKGPAHVQNEGDRPFGCRVQSFGPPVWINTRASSKTAASGVHTVICANRA